MRKNKLFIVVLSFCFIFLNIDNEAFATNKKEGGNKSFTIDSLMKNMEIDFRLNYGFYMHHHYEMSGYRAHFPMFELSLQKQTYGKAYWQSCFNYPAVGVTLFCSNMGNIDVMGKAIALYPYIYFPLIKNTDTNFGIRFGLGLGYLTEKYDHIENPYNMAIGSHLNAAASITFDIAHRFTDRFKMSVFGGLQHFSNGCTAEPNKGTNVIKGGISAAYMINEPVDYIKPHQLNEKKSIEYLKEFRPELYVSMSYGSKRIDYLQEDFRSVYHLEIYVMEQLTRLGKIGIGFDLIYNETDILRNMNNNNGVNTWTTAQIMNPGIHATYELLMGKTSFMFVLGKHLGKEEYMHTERNYQRLAFKHNFTEHFFGKVTLTIHQWHIADFLGWGVGFKL